MTLSQNLLVAKNKVASGSAWILLAEITLTDSSVLRYANNGEDVVFPATAGNTYTARGMSCGGLRPAEPNRLDNVRLAIVNADRVLEAYLPQYPGDTDLVTGGVCTLIMVESSLLDETYTDLTLDYDIRGFMRDGHDLVLELSGDDPQRMRFPRDRYFPTWCNFARDFKGPRCAYVDKTITGVTLSGTDPVLIAATAHLGETGDVFTLAGVAGITPSLAGSWVITRVNANNFTLQGTDSSDYSGSYTSGGTAGHATCDGLYESCMARGNLARYGGFPGLDPSGLIVAAT